MALFELFIPARGEGDFNITARIRGASWIQALRDGLSRLGETADVQNILCDIHEAGIDVTEPKSGRVFRIRELPDSQAATHVAHTQPLPAPPHPKPVVASTRAASAPPAAVTRAPPAVARRDAPQAPILGAPPRATSSGPRARSASLSPIREPATVSRSPAPGRRRFQATVEEESVREERAPASALSAGPSIGRTPLGEAETVVDLLSDLMGETQTLYDQPSLAAAADRLLGLALRVVPAESGAVFVSDINAQDLYFAAARGPKAADVMKFRVPMGTGIVGFSAQEGVSLALSDAQRDPRFYAAISQAIGYETRSIVCAPAQREGRVFSTLR